MRWFRNLSYRNKLFITNLLIVLVVVIGITAMMHMTASRQTVKSNMATLDLLTEQALMNFCNEAEGMGKNIYALYTGANVADQMNRMRNMLPAEREYLSERRKMMQAAGRMLTVSAPYDHASVLLMNQDVVTGNPLDEEASQEAEGILSQPAYAANTYGTCQWVRTEKGNLWCVRDVYCQAPLRRVGKVAVRIRQDQVIRLGQSNDHYRCSLLFFDRDGRWLMAAGDETSEETARLAAALLDRPADTLRGPEGAFAVSIRREGDWQAVGLLPMSTVEGVQRSISRSSLLLALLGILVGLAVATAVSHRLSGQIRRLVQSMNRVAAGDLDVEIPVESQDDIGLLTENFNRTTKKTKELLERVVEEESRKQQAEYKNLEYEYRFLQWQINPHFIYNALETVNALAKLDGNPELSDMILHLSAYFRANAEAMSKRFVTVPQEFSSIRQYVEIYRHIYGSHLIAVFTISPEAEDALVPTMMLQPILENALVHGNAPQQQNRIETSASIQNGELCICVEDNGPGMEKETAERLLRGDEGEKPAGKKASLGLRNVVERMRLLYGDQATLEIESAPGKGTCVTLRLPCRREE